MNICLTMVVECTKKGLFECLWSTTSSVMNMEDWYACKKCPCELKAAAAWPCFFLFILHPVLWGGTDKAFVVLWVPCPATCTLWHQHSIHKDKQCKEAISVCGADKRLNENSPRASNTRRCLMQRSRMPSGVRGTKSGGGGVRVLTRMEVCVLCPWLYRQPAPSSIPVPRVSLAAPQTPGSGCLCQIHWAVGRVSTAAYLVCESGQACWSIMPFSLTWGGL